MTHSLYFFCIADFVRAAQPAAVQPHSRYSVVVSPLLHGWTALFRFAPANLLHICYIPEISFSSQVFISPSGLLPLAFVSHSGCCSQYRLSVKQSSLVGAFVGT
jgi:hypothetical protein